MSLGMLGDNHGPRPLSQMGRFIPLSYIIAVWKHDDPEICEKLSRDLLALFLLRSRVMLSSKENYMLEKQIALLDHRIQLLIHNRVSANANSATTTPSTDNANSQGPILIVLPRPVRLNLPYLTDPAAPVSRIPTPMTLSKSHKAIFEDILYILQQRPMVLAHLTRVTDTGFWGELLVQFAILELYADQDDEQQERLLIDLFSNGLKAEFRDNTERHTLLRSNTTFTQMLSAFARRGKGVGVLKSVLCEGVQAICANTDLNFDLSYDACLRDAGVQAITVTDDTTSPSSSPSLTPLQPVAQSHEPMGSATVQCVSMSRAPTRITWAHLPQPARDLHAQRLEALLAAVNSILDKMLVSAENLPQGVRWVAKYLYHLTKFSFPDKDDSFALTIVGGFVCLRYFNPCIVSPHTFELVKNPPDKLARKNLVMVAKVVQNISNSNMFKENESHLMACNAYITQMIPKMRLFLRKVTHVTQGAASLSEYLANCLQDSTVITSVGHLLGVQWLLWTHFDTLCEQTRAHIAAEKESRKHTNSVRAICDLTLDEMAAEKALAESPDSPLDPALVSAQASGDGKAWMRYGLATLRKQRKRMSFVFDEAQIRQLFRSEDEDGEEEMGDDAAAYEQCLDDDNSDSDAGDEIEEEDGESYADDPDLDAFCEQPVTVAGLDTPPTVFAPSSTQENEASAPALVNMRTKALFERGVQSQLTQRPRISATGLPELRYLLLLLGRPPAVTQDQLRTLKDVSLVLRPKDCTLRNAPAEPSAPTLTTAPVPDLPGAVAVRVCVAPAPSYAVATNTITAMPTPAPAPAPSVVTSASIRAPAQQRSGPNLPIPPPPPPSSRHSSNASCPARPVSAPSSTAAPPCSFASRERSGAFSPMPSLGLSVAVPLASTLQPAVSGAPSPHTALLSGFNSRNGSPAVFAATPATPPPPPLPRTPLSSSHSSPRLPPPLPPSSPPPLPPVHTPTSPPPPGRQAPIRPLVLPIATTASAPAPRSPSTSPATTPTSLPPSPPQEPADALSLPDSARLLLHPPAALSAHDELDEARDAFDNNIELGSHARSSARYGDPSLRLPSPTRSDDSISVFSASLGPNTPRAAHGRSNDPENSFSTATNTSALTAGLMDYYNTAICSCSAEDTSDPAHICTCAVALTPLLQNIASRKRKQDAPAPMQADVAAADALVYAKLVNVNRYTPPLHAVAYRVAKVYRPTSHRPSVPAPTYSAPAPSPASSAAHAPLLLSSIQRCVLLASALPASLLLRYLRASAEWVRVHIDPLYHAHVARCAQTQPLADTDVADEALEHSDDSDCESRSHAVRHYPRLKKSPSAHNDPATGSHADRDSDEEMTSTPALKRVHSDLTSSRGSLSTARASNNRSRARRDPFGASSPSRRNESGERPSGLQIPLDSVSPNSLRAFTLPSDSPYYTGLFPHHMPPSVRVFEVFVLLRYLATTKHAGLATHVPLDIPQWCTEKQPAVTATLTLSHDTTADVHAAPRSPTAIAPLPVVNMPTQPPPPPPYPPTSASEPSLPQPDAVLPPHASKEKYKRLLRRSVLATQRAQRLSVYARPTPTRADRDIDSFDGKFGLPTRKFDSNIFERAAADASDANSSYSTSTRQRALGINPFNVSADAMAAYQQQSHVCGSSCAGLCCFGIDDVMLTVTPKIVKVPGEVGMLDRRVVSWACKWAVESVGGVRVNLVQQADAKLAHVRETIGVIAQHQWQLRARQDMYREYVEMCKQHGTQPLQPEEAPGLFSSMITVMKKSLLGSLVKGGMFQLGLKKAMEGGSAAIRALQEGAYTDLFTGSRFHFQGDVNNVKCRTYRASLLQRKGVLVCATPEFMSSCLLITVAQATPMVYLFYVSSSKGNWGVAIDLEDLLKREEATVLARDRGYYDSDMPLTTIDLRRLRPTITREECQMNGWQVYEDDLAQPEGLCRLTVIGADQVGRLVSVMWVKNEVVLEVSTLLDRVLRKHFIR